MTTDQTRHLRREIGTFALMLTGLSTIIGSGWLFGAWRASQLAGTGAVWAWVIGAIVAIVVALTYAEMGAMFPESGGMVRYAHYSHGSLLGFIAAWTGWIAIVSVIPAEAESSVQYMASWHWAWAQDLYAYKSSGGGVLTTPGLAIAAVLVVCYFLLNFWGVKLFVRSNSVITLFKLVVPAGTAIVLMLSGFDASNFGPDVPGNGNADIASILTAVATAGIVFSFNGFQSPVNLAGEARTPGRSIPFAVMGCIVLAAVVYILLQVAYLGAVPHAQLVAKGWHGINFRSPFAQLALILNLNWLAILLYTDAFVSPSGTGITYTATTARMIYGMERNGTLPAVFGHIDPGAGVPRPAMWLNLVVSFAFLFFFRDWGDLAAVISVATVIGYVTGPISVVVLRKTAAAAHRPMKVPLLTVVAAVAFIFATELMYWARWPLTGQVILLIVIALPLYGWYQSRAGFQGFGRHLRGALWLITYLPAVALVSWAGSTRFGGHGYLKWGWDLLVVAAIAIAFFIWAVRSGWQTPAVLKACEEVPSAPLPSRSAPVTG